MLQVMTDEEGGLDPQNSANAVANIFLYQGALDKCNLTIKKYNEVVSGVGK